MQLKNEHYSFAGMQRDLVSSKHPTTFLYDARNIRLTSRNDDTLFAITNEKGTVTTNITIPGRYLGHSLLNQYLVVFSKSDTLENPDHITRIDLDKIEVTSLYDGDLNFSLGYPIETVCSYENNNIQKVYWTDGINQPRFINIVADKDTTANYNSNSFDFVPELELRETVKVKRRSGVGNFESGVIQYAFTYYNKYGQESNIFWVTPLYYVAPLDRGASPEEKVGIAFDITISNIQKSTFEFIRIYSIQRTSINGTPYVKRVEDIPIDKVSSFNIVTYTDTGNNGDVIDPTELLYKGGLNIKAGTMEPKDNTLFLGNITLVNTHPINLIGKDYKSSILNNITITPSKKTLTIRDSGSDSYKYGNQLSATIGGYLAPCSGFKAGNTYRLGIQFQYKNGQWSDVLYKNTNDGANWDIPLTKTDDILPSYDNMYQLTLPIFKGTIPKNVVDTLIGAGYRKVRAVFVYPEPNDRAILCQGIKNPVLTTSNGSYLQASWFFRPECTKDTSDDGIKVAPTLNGASLYYTSNNIGYDPKNIRKVEIQGSYVPNEEFFSSTLLHTFHSPDIELSEYLYNYDFTNCDGYRVVGEAEITNTLSDIDIQTETPTISNNGAGFIHKSFNTKGPWGIVSGLFYDDYTVNDVDGELVKLTRQKATSKWLIYPWQADGSLNNDITRPANKGTASAVLKKKVISNLRYTTTHFWNVSNFGNRASGSSQRTPQLFNSNEDTILKFGDTIYKGNIDVALVPNDADGTYFASDNIEYEVVDEYPQVKYGWKWNTTETSFESDNWFKTFSLDSETNNQSGLYKWIDPKWTRVDDGPGENFIDLTMKKGVVKMKYKSSPHLVFT